MNTDEWIPIHDIPAPFWFVWREGHAGPTQKHATEAEAIAEASRLAEKHRESRFAVLRSIAQVQCVVTQTRIIVARTSP